MAKGEITHIEFPADDPERAKRFYEAVAGWKFGETEGFPGYYMFRNGEASGGAVARRGEMAPQQLRIYITVDSLEEACAAAAANGGTVVEQPSDIGGGMGRFAVVRDTEGSEVGLWQTTGADAG
ncbi:MAG TPA: VOC family protein [Candidatus Limnocylindrales bacterium]